MQQWEDWGTGYDWRLLAEKTTATLLVLSLSIWLWRVLAAWRLETPVRLEVQVPSVLATAVKREWPSEEVSVENAESNMTDPSCTDCGRQDLSPSSSRWTTPPSRTDHTIHDGRH